MKQGFERSSRHAADGEHAGDALGLPDRGLKRDVDAGRPSDDHRPLDAVRVHHREKVVGVVRNADPRLVGGAFRSAETAMVPRHHPVGVGAAVDVRPGMVGSAQPVGDQHGNAVAVVVPGPQTRPITGCDRSIPQRPPCLMVPTCLIDCRWRERWRRCSISRSRWAKNPGIVRHSGSTAR
jgi:hypothetical protein